MLKIKSGGDFTKAGRYLQRLKNLKLDAKFDQAGRRGVAALASATPVDSGLSAASWTYDILRRPGRISIVWRNTNIVDGTPVVIMLQYGHSTGTGGWVQGRDFVNPAIQPIFDQINQELWREVTSG